MGVAAGLSVRLGDVIGPGGGTLLLGLAGIGLWRSPTLRNDLWTQLRRSAERRWVNRGLEACGLIGPWGGRPRIERIDSVPAGIRVDVRTPLGHHSGHLLAAAPTLEAALRVQEVRVTRELHDASLAHLLVVRRDPLSRRARRSSGPGATPERRRAGTRSPSASTKAGPPPLSPWPSTTCCSAASPEPASPVP